VTSGNVPPATRRLIDFLGELGPRWGLPAQPCRVHGYLYLVARPVAEAELGALLELDDAALREALAWLIDYRLVERDGSGAWMTASDPWDLMMRALEERRRRELTPVLDLLRECQSAALADRGHDRAVVLQIAKLLSLVEDLAAIDMQARRLSPKALRQMIGIGGRAARFLDRTWGGRGRS
jgi:DNA-binding transcriptional regulator GbsR (MarR family)